MSNVEREPKLAEQIEACEQAARASDYRAEIYRQRLCAAARTLRELQDGRWLRVRVGKIKPSEWDDAGIARPKE